MNPRMLIKEIVEDMRTLPARDIKTIAEFVDFIKDRELEEDILTSKKIIRSVKSARTAWKNNKFSDFISWEELKNKHHLDV